MAQAGAGIEPANSGFADRDLTTWLPRRFEKRQTILVSSGSVNVWWRHLLNDLAI